MSEQKTLLIMNGIKNVAMWAGTSVAVTYAVKKTGSALPLMALVIPWYAQTDYEYKTSKGEA